MLDRDPRSAGGGAVDPASLGLRPDDARTPLPRAVPVRNKAPAAKQMTTEQLLREAKHMQLEEEAPAPRSMITDPGECTHRRGAPPVSAPPADRAHSLRIPPPRDSRLPLPPPCLAEELARFRLKKRMEMEDLVRRVGRWNLPVWLKYAAFEEDQNDLQRARNVFERALQVDPGNLQFWTRYAEMEMRHGAVASARNVWDRACGLLPRQDQLWARRVHLEEMLGDFAGARAVYERWMAWEPDATAWRAYVNFELRYAEVGRARAVLRRLLACRPEPAAYLSLARFEERHGRPAFARAAFEALFRDLGDEASGSREAFQAFADYETRQGELERARAVYRHALGKLPAAEAAALREDYTRFEKRWGDAAGVEDAVVERRRAEYEAATTADERDVDAWLDRARLEAGCVRDAAAEVRRAAADGGPGAAAGPAGRAARDAAVAAAAGDASTPLGRAASRARAIYDRAAAAAAPPSRTDKRLWRRYLYLFLGWSALEELDLCSIDAARAVLASALALVPHRAFTSGKLWIAAASLELRAGDLPAARKLLGRSLGLAPKASVFEWYIDLEVRLGCVGRVRALYARFIEWDPARSASWVRLAELEQDLGEAARARAVLEAALAREEEGGSGDEAGDGGTGGAVGLDAPEAAWRARIGVEVGEGNRAAARAVYERLLRRTSHPRVWASFAAFEATPMRELQEGEGDGAGAAGWGEGGDDDEAPAARGARARDVYRRGLDAIRRDRPEDGEGAASLCAAWAAHEARPAPLGGTDDERAEVERRRPRRVRRRRALREGGFEEVWEWVHPDAEAEAPAAKLLAAAARWKAAAAARGGG